MGAQQKLPTVAFSAAKKRVWAVDRYGISNDEFTKGLTEYRIRGGKLAGRCAYLKEVEDLCRDGGRRFYAVIIRPVSSRQQARKHPLYLGMFLSIPGKLLNSVASRQRLDCDIQPNESNGYRLKKSEQVIAKRIFWGAIDEPPLVPSKK